MLHVCQQFQHTEALIFFLQRLMMGFFQAFDGIFPSWKKTTHSPVLRLETSALTPQPNPQPPFYKPHTTHILLIGLTKC